MALEAQRTMLLANSRGTPRSTMKIRTNSQKKSLGCWCRGSSMSRPRTRRRGMQWRQQRRLWVPR